MVKKNPAHDSDQTFKPSNCEHSKAPWLWVLEQHSSQIGLLPKPAQCNERQKQKQNLFGVAYNPSSQATGLLGKILI